MAAFIRHRINWIESERQLHCTTDAMICSQPFRMCSSYPNDCQTWLVYFQRRIHNSITLTFCSRKMFVDSFTIRFSCWWKVPKATIVCSISFHHSEKQNQKRNTLLSYSRNKIVRNSSDKIQFSMWRDFFVVILLFFINSFKKIEAFFENNFLCKSWGCRT